MTVVQDQASLTRLHQSKGFSLAFYLTGGDLDAAYAVAASSFAEALRSGPDSFLTNALAAVVQKCRDIDSAVSSDFGPGSKSDPDGALRIVRAALQALSFEDRAFVLLRDQLNLDYGDIAKIMRLEAGDVRRRTIEARSALRKYVEQAVRHA